MEEKAVDEKATSRRSRKDEEGRDFQCGCGKRYLSYPALYTHIKTKHDGRQPQGTLKTGTTQLAKRGKNKMEEQLFKSICSFFHKEELKVLGELEEASGSVPLNSRIRKDMLPKETYQCFQGLLKEKEVKLLPTSSLDLALTVYLFNAGFYVNEKIYQHFLAFVKTARTCFQEYGQDVYRAYFSRREQDGPFVLPTFGNQVRFFPIVADFLLQCYLPQSEARDLNFSLMQLILFDFCNWLSTRKLTHIRCALPKDYLLDYRVQGKQRTPSKQELPAENNDKENREENEDQSEDISENEAAEQEEGQQRAREKEPSEGE